MANGAVKDMFANMAIVKVTESAATTLTWKKLEVGTSLFEKVAIVLHRVEWSFAAGGSGIAAMAGTGDICYAGIANSNTLSSLQADQEGLIVRKRWSRYDFGTAGSGNFIVEPFVDDFSSLPGGGLIMLPTPFYVGVLGASVAAAFEITARILFTFRELKGEDFLELLQARQTLIST